MKEDPISKSQIGPGMGRRRIIDKNQGRGSVPLNKDYSSAFQSQRSRFIFVACCVLPYLIGVVYLYLISVKSIAILLLAIPLFIGLAFWFLFKRMS